MKASRPTSPSHKPYLMKTITSHTRRGDKHDRILLLLTSTIQPVQPSNHPSVQPPWGKLISSLLQQHTNTDGTCSAWRIVRPNRAHTCRWRSFCRCVCVCVSAVGRRCFWRCNSRLLGAFARTLWAVYKSKVYYIVWGVCTQTTKSGLSLCAYVVPIKFITYPTRVWRMCCMLRWRRCLFGAATILITYKKRIIDCAHTIIRQTERHSIVNCTRAGW